MEQEAKRERTQTPVPECTAYFLGTAACLHRPATGTAQRREHTYADMIATTEQSVHQEEPPTDENIYGAQQQMNTKTHSKKDNSTTTRKQKDHQQT